MKTKEKKNMLTARQKKSDIEQLRDIRNKIGIEIQDMSFEQLKKYIEERLTLYPKATWQKQRGTAI